MVVPVSRIFCYIGFSINSSFQIKFKWLVNDFGIIKAKSEEKEEEDKSNRRIKFNSIKNRTIPNLKTIKQNRNSDKKFCILCSVQELQSVCFVSVAF